jgi:acyl-CoA synthetase (AMP-forming)/AMP-acid ligase II
VESLADTLARNAAERGAQPALLDGATRLTHAALLARVAGLAGALAGAAGRRLLLLVPNGHAAVVGHYAAWVAGAETLLLDAQLAAAELEPLVARFAPELIVSVPSATAAVATVQQHVQAQARLILLPEDEGDEVPGGVATATRVPWTDTPPAGRLQDHGTLDRVCLVLNTTGTTGARKLVSLTPRNLLAAARNINERMQIGAAAREVCPLPLHRSFGLGRARCLTLAGGMLIVAPPRGDRALALVQQHRATGLAGVPTFFRMLIRTFGPRLGRYLEGIEYVEIGSAPMERADKLFLLEAAPRARLYMHYGLTEASRSAFIEFRAERAKLETVGRAAPHVALRVVREDGSPCRPGETGEIVVRGEHVCAGYWGDPALTATRLGDGWLHTHDYGSLDADGYCHFSGRMDDVMNVGGVKVSPEKIERVARTMPGVLDCAAVAGDDPRGVYGQVPLLFVVGDRAAPLSGQTVRAYCAQRLLPEEVPYEVRFIDAIPRTDTGKVQRGRLRAART